MNTMLVEDTTIQLTAQLRRWDRRWRLVKSLLWGPRGLILGLLVGVIIAAISRLRPWLLPEQIALVAVGATLVIGIGVLAIIWLWPRPVARAARYFDRQFGLQERMSTAFELTRGLIPVPEELGERQLFDAMNTAQGVNVARRLPARVRIWEIVIMIVLAVLMLILLLTDNPKTGELRARRGLQNAITNQIGALEEQIQAIEQNESLTPEEKEALTQPLEETKEILEQPEISQPEAMAALSEAEQQLEEYSDGMPPEEEGAYQEAADALRDSDLTSDLSDAMEDADLGASAEALEDMADQIEQDRLSESEQQELAEQLEAAAEALEASNPELAEQLREAAEALREGDRERAEEALREAAEQLREQQERNENSQMAESAEEALQRLEEAKQELAEAGQEREREQGEQGEEQQQSDQEGQQGQEGQDGDQSEQQGQQSEGQEGQQGEESDQGQQGDQQSGQQGEQQSAQPGQEGEAVQSDQAQPGDNGVPGEQQSSQTGEQQGSQQESGQSGEQSNGEGGESQQGGTTQSSETGAQASLSRIPGSSSQSASAPSAGEGEGGAGTDTITGIPDTANQEISTSNSPSGTGGGPQSYNPQAGSSSIGGQSNENIDVGGEPTDSEGIPVQEGEFGENPTGESERSYTSVYDNYQDAVSDALESGRIPLDQRDVIHDYFSSLEP